MRAVEWHLSESKLENTLVRVVESAAEGVCNTPFFPLAFGLILQVMENFGSADWCRGFYPRFIYISGYKPLEITQTKVSGCKPLHPS
jgi:hypothetical protein